MQRDRFSRFQPTYPYLQHQIDLPPTISLSDGEEPPPYQGPCTLQLRDPEQQMELNRESVRAPPNRTIYDSDLIDMGGGGSLGRGGGGTGGGGPRPPSSNSGISVANSSNHGRMEGPPPAYSEVMGNYPGSAFFLHQHSNNQRVGGPGGRTIHQQSQSESTIVPAKAKDGHPDDLVWTNGWQGPGLTTVLSTLSCLSVRSGLTHSHSDSYSLYRSLMFSFHTLMHKLISTLATRKAEKRRSRSRDQDECTAWRLLFSSPSHEKETYC